MISDEELEAMKPTLMALFKELQDPPGTTWEEKCSCTKPDEPCKDRWKCKRRRNRWKQVVREHYIKT